MCTCTEQWRTLAQTLMDKCFPTNYDEWTILFYYNGEGVAIKLLERPENNEEGAQLVEQQFAQGVMKLATLKLPNVVQEANGLA